MRDVGRILEDVRHLLLQLDHRLEGDVLPRFGRDLQLADVLLREEALRNDVEHPAGGGEGGDRDRQRAGQPEEVAPCYVFLASSDSKYMTGQMLHPNGGEVVNA